MFNFIGNIIKIPFDILLYVPRRTPVIKHFFLPKNSENFIDFSCHKILLLPQFFIKKKSDFDKVFIEIFGYDGQNILNEKRIPFINETYRERYLSRSYNNFFSNKEEFEKLIDGMSMSEMAPSWLMEPFAVIVNEQTAEKIIANQKYFRVLLHANETKHLAEYALATQRTKIAGKVFCDALEAANMDTRCDCNADYRTHVDEDIDNCGACYRDIENYINPINDNDEQEENIDFDKIRDDIQKEIKAFYKRVGYNDAA